MMTQTGKLRFGRQKGYIYTIEVMLAVATIMVVVVLTFSSTPEQPETNIALIKQAGYDSLQYLDQNGLLRSLASDNTSYTNLKNNVSSLMSSSISFDLAVCSTSCNSTGIPANRTVITVDYYVAGYNDRYIEKKVRLWMWELF